MKPRLVVRRRKPVPRTNVLAYVATENPVFKPARDILRDFFPQLDGKIADALACVNGEWLGYCVGGTSVHAGRARSAVVLGRTIDVEIPPWRDSLMLVVRYVPTWLFIGVGTWAVARSLTPDASFARIMFASV